MKIDNKEYLTAEKVSVGYNGKKLVSDINLKCNKGDIITLIGPNGCGKSTVIKNLIREYSVLEGIIAIDGRNINSYKSSEYAKKVSVVLTQKLKTNMMSCRDIVSMGRYPYTNYFGKLTQKDRIIVDKALERVNITDIQNMDYCNLSDGQKQRVMLARAICQEPEILILDEPTSFLDIKYKIELLGIIRDMAKNEGVTVIMSLHEIDLAYKVSDYIISIDSNHKMKFGKTNEIFIDQNINKLYDIKNGSYDINSGSIELQKPTGDARVMVIGGGGLATPYYRELQRQNIAFVTGVLFENDIDFPVAKALAKYVISQEAFTYISEEKIKEACRVVDSVDFVIDAKVPIGEQNQKLQELIDYSQNKIKLF